MNQAFFIAFLLIIMTHQVEYLKNTDLIESSCTDSYSSPQGCWRTKLSDDSWVGKRFSDNTDDSFEIINSKNFNSSAPNSFAIRLTNKLDVSAQPMCIVQAIPYLPPGSYALNFIAFVESDHPHPQEQTMMISIKNEMNQYDRNMEMKVFNKNFTFEPEGFQLQITELIQVKIFFQSAYIRICDSSNQSYHSFAVRNIKLVKLDDNCDPATASSQVLVDGSCECIPHKFVYDSANCRIFSKLGENSWDCAICDHRSSTPYRLPTDYGYHVCGQVNAPNANYYQIINILDITGQIIVYPASCKQSGTTGRLAIPNHEAPEGYKFEGPACTNKTDGVEIWNVINDKYVPVKCLDTYGQAYIGSQKQERVCISKETKAYDANCLQYEYVEFRKTYNCTKCKQPYLKALVGEKFPYHTNCILEADRLSNCLVYSKYQNDKRSYSCHVCLTGYFQVPVGNKDEGYVNNVCSKFPPFYWTNTRCLYYDSQSVDSSYLKCGYCTLPSYNPQLCRHDPFSMDNCTGVSEQQNGIEVYVNGIRHCALGMVVNHCADYEAIHGKVLTKCQQCKFGYIPTMNGLICGKRKPDCARLKDDNVQECALCINPNWQIVEGECTCSFAQQTSNGRKSCTTCNPGYTLVNVTKQTVGQSQVIHLCISPYERRQGCSLYYQQDSVFECQTCFQEYQKSGVFGSNWPWVGIRYGCVKKTEIVPHCNSYYYLPNSCKKLCQDCQVYFTARKFNISGELINRCFKQSELKYIDYCIVYREPIDEIHYCQLCDEHSLQIPVGPNAMETVCVLRTIYDSSKVKQCLYYKRSALKEQKLVCQKCKNDNLAAPNCQPA